MDRDLNEMRTSPLLWLLVFVPVVLAGERPWPDRHTLLFLLSVLAIVPLAALLSRATESMAARTGDAVGDLLNATLGNLTELVIALAALQAGQYLLVKASIAGAIVTNTLFMLGGSFLIGGLKYHEQEFNRITARVQSGLLFLATVALLVPSFVAQMDGRQAVTQPLSLGLAGLLILGYGLSLVFSLKTHQEVFASAGHGEADEGPWPIKIALFTLALVTVLVAIVSEVFVSSVQIAAGTLGMSPAFVGFVVVAIVGAAAEMTTAFSAAPKNRLDLRRHCARQRRANCTLRGAAPRALELCHRAGTDEPAVLAGRHRDDADRDHGGCADDERRSLRLVRRRNDPMVYAIFALTLFLLPPAP